MPELFAWIGYLVSAWLAADFITGFVHWWEDRYAKPGWPILGPLVAEPNELHHADQTAFLRGSYWFRNSTSLIPSAGFALTFIALGQWWWLLVTAFASQANEIHCWAHSGNHGRLVKALQETGIIQNPRHHSRHHTRPFDSHFCVMTCWLNPVLDALGFWRGLEWVIRVVGRVKVKEA